MNPEFIEVVKAGKIEGCKVFGGRFAVDGTVYAVLDNYGWLTFNTRPNNAHLCAHLRRWMTGKGWKWSLREDQFTAFRLITRIKKRPVRTFNEGSELDWQIAAVMFVLGQEEDREGDRPLSSDA